MSPIESLKNKAYNWARSVVELHNTPVPPHMQGEKDRLLSRAKTVKVAIEKVFGTLEELKPITSIDTLGALPVLVPAAVIAAAAAAIGAWYYQYNKLKTRITEYQRLTGGGLTHKQAIQVVGDATDKSLSIKSVAKYGGFAIIGLIGFQMLKALK